MRRPIALLLLTLAAPLAAQPTRAEPGERLATDGAVEAWGDGANAPAGATPETDRGMRDKGAPARAARGAVRGRLPAPDQGRRLPGEAPRTDALTRASSFVAPATATATASLRITLLGPLAFQTIAVDAMGGSVAMDAASGALRPSGAVAIERRDGFAAEVLVEGAPGQAIRIALPPHFDLRGPGNQRARLSDVTADSGPRARLGDDGRLVIRIAGRIDVAAASAGRFRGSLPLRIDAD